MDEWASVDPIVESSGGIKEWKFGSDSQNIYFYFKIKKSSIKASDDGTYKKKRYIYIGLNTDNKSSSGYVPSYTNGTKTESYGALTFQVVKR